MQSNVVVSRVMSRASHGSLTHIVAYETLITVRQEDTGNIRMSWQPQVRLMTNFSNNGELSPT